MDEYDQARDRVEGDPEMQALADVILYDGWTESDYWQWVITAPRDEIVSWAKAIRDA